MPRLTAKDFQPEVLQLFDRYVHGDITRRIALDGFLAFAPDALSSLGGYPGDEDKARALFSRLDAAKTTQDFLAATRALLTFPQSTGKVGAVGFCYGGGVVNILATQVPELAAAVPFYGAQPSAPDVAKIKAPLLIHYAGVQHGFNNDTTPRFDVDAAKLAWQRTMAFFKANLA